MDNESFEVYDSIGGYHADGCGWDPDGHPCGECSSLSCADCPVWQHHGQMDKNY